MNSYIKTCGIFVLNLLLISSCSTSTTEHEERKIKSIEWGFDSVPNTSPDCIEIEGIDSEDVSLTDKTGVGAIYSTDDTLYFKGKLYSGIIKSCRDGKLTKRWTYENGVSNGLLVFYYEYDGGLEKVWEVTDNNNGRIKEYYKSGIKKLEGHYNEGNKDKKWTYFDEKGVVRKIEIYEGSVLVSCEGACE